MTNYTRIEISGSTTLYDIHITLWADASKCGLWFKLSPICTEVIRSEVQQKVLLNTVEALSWYAAAF